MGIGFGWFGRKKAKLVTGPYRGAQEQTAKGSDPRRWKRRSIVAAAFAIIVASLSIEVPTEKLDEGIDTTQLARESVYAQFPFEVEDRDATMKAQDAAAALVPDTYRVNVGRVKEQLAQFREQVDRLRAQREPIEQAVRKALLASTSAQDENEIVTSTIVSFARDLAQDPEFQGVQDVSALAIWLMPTPQSVPKRVFGPPVSAQDPNSPKRTTELANPEGPVFQLTNVDYLAKVGEKALLYVLSYGMLQPKDHPVPSATGQDKILILRDEPVEGQTLREEIPLAQIPVMANARLRLATRVGEEIKETPAAASASSTDAQGFERAAYEVAQLAIASTLSFYSEETERQREKARADVKPIMRAYRPNELIQERGKPWSPQSILAYDAHQKLKEQRTSKTRDLYSTLIAHSLLAGLVLLCLLRAMPLMARKPQEDDFLQTALSLLILSGTLIAGRVISYFDNTGLTVPIAAGAILLTILMNVRVAMLASLLTSVLVSAQYYYSWNVVVVGFAMSFAGVVTISSVRRRSDMTGASLMATAVGLIVMGAIVMGTGAIGMGTGASRLVLILLNGLACLFLVPGLLSPLERLSGITTDIQLLEYSDLNNEVLSRLAIEVPATYAHSLMLGQLAEAAADAIGANGLLARVCAYYHDIGKIRRPEYFIENQTGVNVHDELSPRLSARAIASHVIEGAEIAREFHLPKPIINGIFEHHGTCLISFFYQQAVAQQKHGDVEQADFRYPGPKPQTPETAILMICDAVESGVRSMKNPTEERVREFVEKIIDARAQDRQFDECDLTLRDLDTIAAVVARRIKVSMHTRIAYPGQDDRKTDNVIPIGGGAET